MEGDDMRFASKTPVTRLNGTEAFPYPDYLLNKVRDTAHPSDSECWPWPLYINPGGYGSTSWYDGFRTHLALIHRISWVIANGRPIPDQMTVHHVCYNRACWNPVHLSLLSAVDNSRDNKRSRDTHCKWGHEFTEANTRITTRGWRFCRACGREDDKRRAAGGNRGYVRRPKVAP